jgi:hypothetical protein
MSLRGAGALVVEALTPKECEVLGYLAELLTTEEPAAKMFVSVNTVSTHARCARPEDSNCSTGEHGVHPSGMTPRGC